MLRSKQTSTIARNSAGAMIAPGEDCWGLRRSIREALSGNDSMCRAVRWKALSGHNGFRRPCAARRSTRLISGIAGPRHGNSVAHLEIM